MLLRNVKWYNLSQIDIDEKNNLLLKEFKEVKFWLDRVKKQLKEEATDRRTRRSDKNERDGDDITRRIKVLPPYSMFMILGFLVTGWLIWIITLTCIGYPNSLKFDLGASSS